MLLQHPERTQTSFSGPKSEIAKIEGNSNLCFREMLQIVDYSNKL